MLAHKAEEDGVACVEGMKTGYSHVDYDLVPAVVFTHPEIGAVGKTEEQLVAAGTAFKKGVFPFRANGRARTINDTTGKVFKVEEATLEEGSLKLWQGEGFITHLEQFEIDLSGMDVGRLTGKTFAMELGQENDIVISLYYMGEEKGEINNLLKSMASSHAYKSAYKTASNLDLVPYVSISDSRDIRKGPISTTKDSGALRTWYRIRGNSLHRGKSGSDTEIVEDASIGLGNLLLFYLEAQVPGIREEWDKEVPNLQPIVR
jgi:hypothetical protein